MALDGDHQAMLTGKDLGSAIGAAIKKKKEIDPTFTQKALAQHFGIAPPSVQDWIKSGTIGKDKLVDLWLFFADVVGPEHWGLPLFWGSPKLSPEAHSVALTIDQIKDEAIRKSAQAKLSAMVLHYIELDRVTALESDPGSPRVDSMPTEAPKTSRQRRLG